MYNPRARIIIDGEDKTDPSNAVGTPRPNRCQVIFCNFQTYSYVLSKVLWLKDPVVFDPQHYLLGAPNEPLSYIAAFQQGVRRRYVEYANGTGAHSDGNELVRSCLEEPPA